METVSKILWHSNIRITQKAYGKIVDRKVSHDMRDLGITLPEKERINKLGIT